jgi:negative regulator of sigma E activity
MDRHLETLSALLDGAPIQIAALEAALADTDARRGLVDFVLLRQLARDDDATPRPDFARKTERAIARRRTFARLRVPLPLAAAAVLLALLGGSLIDVKSLWPEREQTPHEQVQPPTPSRVLQFDAAPPEARNAGPGRSGR